MDPPRRILGRSSRIHCSPSSCFIFFADNPNMYKNLVGNSMVNPSYLWRPYLRPLKESLWRKHLRHQSNLTSLLHRGSKVTKVSDVTSSAFGLQQSRRSLFAVSLPRILDRWFSHHISNKTTLVWTTPVWTAGIFFSFCPFVWNKLVGWSEYSRIISKRKALTSHC